MKKNLCTVVENEGAYRTILQGLKNAGSVHPSRKKGLQKLYKDWWMLAKYADLYRFSLPTPNHYFLVAKTLR